MFTPRITPNEKGRQRITLPGTVTSHEIVDQRWQLTKWLEIRLSPRLVNFFGLRDNLHYMAKVHIDDDCYAEARDKLQVSDVNGGTYQIHNDICMEIPKEVRDGVYAVGKRVAITYGISSVVDQFFTGTTPLRWDMKPINSRQQFEQMPGAVMPTQASFFFT